MKLQSCLQPIMVAVGVLVAGRLLLHRAIPNNTDKITALDAPVPAVKVANDVILFGRSIVSLKNTSMR